MDYGLKVFVLILAGHFGLLAHYLKSYLRSQTGVTGRKLR